MSYCRWSTPNCDFYIYDDVYGGITTHVVGSSSFNGDREETLAFLKQKINEGYQLPIDVLQCIEDDLEKYGPTQWLECAVNLEEYHGKV